MFFIFITSVCALQIHFKLPPRQNRCFGERLQNTELVQGSVIADFEDFSVKITEVETNKQIHYSFNAVQQKYSYIATNSTSIQICIHNVGRTTLSLQFDIDILLDQALSMAELKEIQQYIKHYNQSIQHVKVEQKDIRNKQENRNQRINTLSTNILLLSGITISLMVMGTVFQTFRAKSLINKQKNR